MKVKASELAAYVGGTLHGDDVLIDGTVVTDSRQATPRGLYAARIGENLDGHRFVTAAAESGAIAALVQYKRDWPLSQILVKDSTEALGLTAKFWVEKLRGASEDSMQVIGVTGSAGKTTTKDLMARIFSSQGPTIANVGSFNNEVGMPLTALRADEETRFLVCEMGADKIGDLEYLTSLVPLDVAVVLFVGTAHLGHFGSREAVAQAKSELISGLRSGGIAVLNYDDDNVRAMADLANGQIRYFSAQGNHAADFYATDIQVDDLGRASFTLHSAEGEYPLALGLVGEHHVSNALAAIAAAASLNVSVEAAVSAVAAAEPDSPHRMNTFERAGVRYIDDSYNANPDSLRAALKALHQLGPLGVGGRTIAVVGAMLELGEASDQLHADIGHIAVAEKIDFLLTVGDETIPTHGAAQQQIEAIHCGDIEEAKTRLYKLIQPGDTVLLKGSYGSKIWTIADEVTEELMPR
ncbi:UDP-N-acetylmuramoyl-tripeptide--D-alanyl-D-alanine ligase [Boudabousia marimammalium]|uniref:UDP-N-acetylmuramoyl-tripeptide--D-alanyl-D-alanine ligase n=1 Tax=Boudabousia marimammalium TaxID=156892 RepID=A0A1Q5PP14_9ACTO|nr:UDP-N-acetylmuramoyl-tripeptide--D-alanyl-D-alanine ligase [Boudabousia marimammalium]OKL49246.1 hypothetical protein BM477_04455 [Boudabousia marimammalium]